jgi:hypothetical protein
MERIKENEEREHRIVMEVVVDAYGEIERAISWYYYLEENLEFPFKARCRVKRAISPLKIGEQVQVMAMAPEEECESEIFVWIKRAGEKFAVPLAQLDSASSNPETQEAVADWGYWVARGYQF